MPFKFVEHIKYHMINESLTILLLCLMTYYINKCINKIQINYNKKLILTYI